MQNLPYSAAEASITRTLVAHLIGTSMLCLTLIVMAWLLALVFHQLDAIHPFGNEFRAVLNWLELYSFALETMLCVAGLSAGAFRFCRTILRSPL